MVIRRQRLERAVNAVRQHNVDMWISYAREMSYNGDAMLRYILPMDVFGPVALIITPNDEKIAIIGRMESEELESNGIFSEVIVNVKGIKTHIAEVVRDRQPKRIALNFSEKDPTSDGLSLTGYRLLMGAFEEAGFNGEIVSSQQLLKLVRGNKSPEEVEKIYHAVQESMKIYEQARPLMRIGMSGMDIQRLFQRLADEKGYGYSWPKYGNPFNSIGTRSSYLCKRPADDVYIQPGDVINVDFGLKVDGFSSDNQRTFYALREGETCPPYEVQKAFDVLGQVNQAVIKHMKTGVNSGELLQYANEIMVANGYPEYKGGLGHEIGYYAHDGVLSPGSSFCEPDIDATLLEGMTFTLEPAIITSCGRICREEVVAVTNEGGRLLSNIQEEIWLIRE